MKRILIVCFCLLAFIARSQTPDWSKFDSIFGVKYTPTDTPAWLLPMVFRHQGQQDTMFFIFDTRATEFFASNKLDLNLGERAQSFDKTKFNTRLTVGYKDSSGVRTVYESRVFAVPPSYRAIVCEVRTYQEDIYSEVDIYWDNSRFARMEALLPYTLDTAWLNGREQSLPNKGRVDMKRNSEAIALPYFIGGGNGVIFPFKVTIEVKKMLDIADNAATDFLAVYPNPVDKTFSLTFKEGLKGSLRITSISGQLMYEEEVAAQNAECIINAASWPSGCYFLQFKNHAGTYYHKIVKQ